MFLKQWQKIESSTYFSRWFVHFTNKDRKVSQFCCAHVWRSEVPLPFPFYVLHPSVDPKKCIAFSLTLPPPSGLYEMGSSSSSFLILLPPMRRGRVVCSTLRFDPWQNLPCSGRVGRKDRKKLCAKSTLPFSRLFRDSIYWFSTVGKASNIPFSDMGRESPKIPYSRDAGNSHFATTHMSTNQRCR